MNNIIDRMQPLELLNFTLSELKRAKKALKHYKKEGIYPSTKGQAALRKMLAASAQVIEMDMRTLPRGDNS